MVLSQSLNMVGVELRATWSKTKQVNGEFSQDRITSVINSWKSGKFMELTCRPWSVNNYALSRIWHRAHTVDLRVVDINKISSKIKSWIFQDQLEKPEEFVLYRHITQGGLSLHNVKVRSKALLIKTFIETAIDPKYNQSLAHNLAYRYHILQDDSIESPPQLPQCITEKVVTSIKNCIQNTDLNVSKMSTAQWYKFLLEEELMEENELGIPVLIRTRGESNFQEIDWDRTWQRARLRGLGAEALSFLWKMLHTILPTDARLARILQNATDRCKLCPEPITADLPHCLFNCVITREVGEWLLQIVKQHDRSVNAVRISKLDFACEPSYEMPLVWLIAHTLLYLWNARQNGNTVNVRLTRSMLERKIAILRKTRFGNEAHILTGLIDM